MHLNDSRGVRKQIRATRYLSCCLASLGAPDSLLAIGLLLANDHLLKTRYPSWITGKLSDFAGLYIAPLVFLTTLFSTLWLLEQVARSRNSRSVLLPDSIANRLSLGIFVGTGVVFAALKVSPITAQPALGLIRLVTGRWYAAVPDPSDLIALSMIPLAYLKWKRRFSGRTGASLAAGLRHEGFRGRRRLVLQIALLTVAATAMIATSPPPLIRIVDLAVDSQNPKLLYAVKSYSTYTTSLSLSSLSFWRSTDGGNSWQARGQGGWRIIADPTRAGRFYLIGAQGIQRLTDEPFALEDIWKPEPAQMGGLVQSDWDKVAVEIPATEKDVIYVGITGAILRSQDGGSTWASLPLPGSPERIVTAIASSPSAKGRLLAVKDGSVYRSDDRGDTWRELSTFDLVPYSLAIHPKNPDLVIAANHDAIRRSEDGGRTWKEVWTDRPATPNPLVQPVPPNYWGREWVIAFDPENEKAVYVLERGRALLASFDSGQTWQTLIDNDTYDVVVAPSPNHRAYLAAGEKGVFRQRGDLKPKGQGWEKANNGLGIK